MKKDHSIGIILLLLYRLCKDSRKYPIIREGMSKYAKKFTSLIESKRAPFGIILHWGVYSVPGYDDIKSAHRRRTQNGSEWYLRRLTEKGTYRPISGYKETQAYHRRNYPDMEYADFAPMFLSNSSNWNPESWIQYFKHVKCEFLIITAKHHDGYCLWPSKTGHQTGSNVDIIGTLAYYAQQYGLQFGIYYSWFEFGVSVTKDYLTTTVTPQLEELEKYKPDIWWFDGDWECKSQYAKTYMTSFCKRARKLNPNVLINDRIGLSRDSDGLASYRVYNDRTLPTNTGIPQEHINTIGLSWGYNRDQKPDDYKTVKELIELYEETTSVGCRFLLNMGPLADGTLDPIEVERLTGLGSYISSQKRL